MFVWMRTHQRWLMLIVAILTIIAFTFLYSTTELDQLSTPSFARIYGKDISLEQVEREARTYNLALALGLYDYVGTLDGVTGQPDPGRYVFNARVVRHEAGELGIAPTDKQVAEAIEKLAVFQTNGAFDWSKYEQFQTNFLGPQGFSTAKVEDLVRDSLMLERITEIVESAATAPDAEVDLTARALQKVKAVALRLETEAFRATAEVPAEEIQTFYDARKEQYVSPELRSVDFVKFSLSEADATLTDKARIDALQKVADQSATFADEAATTGFEAAATKAGLTVETTPAFERDGSLPETEGETPPTPTAPLLRMAPVAFTLSKDNPVSGVIQVGDDFYVLNLAKVEESRQLTLDEARPRIIDEVRTLNAAKALEEKAKSSLTQLRSDLAAGKSIEEAAQAAGFQTAPVDGVAPAGGADSKPEQIQYADATMLLNPGEVSGFQFEPWGGFAVYLTERLPLEDEAKAKNREQASTFVKGRKEGILLYEWLDGAVDRSGLSFGQAALE